MALYIYIPHFFVYECCHQVRIKEFVLSGIGWGVWGPPKVPSGPWQSSGRVQGTKLTSFPASTLKHFPKWSSVLKLCLIHCISFPHSSNNGIRKLTTKDEAPVETTSDKSLTDTTAGRTNNNPREKSLHPNKTLVCSTYFFFCVIALNINDIF